MKKLITAAIALFAFGCADAMEEARQIPRKITSFKKEKTVRLKMELNNPGSKTYQQSRKIDFSKNVKNSHKKKIKKVWIESVRMNMQPMPLESPNKVSLRSNVEKRPLLRESVEVARLKNKKASLSLEQEGKVFLQKKAKKLGKTRVSVEVKFPKELKEKTSIKVTVKAKAKISLLEG